MKYHVSYIDDPAQDVDIEADDLNLGPQTVSFYKDPKGTQLRQDGCHSDARSGHEDHRRRQGRVGRRTAHRCLALVVPHPPLTIQKYEEQSHGNTCN